MKFNPAKDIPNLSGKPGNVGIGASIVKALAPHDAHVFICARRVPSAEALVKEIQRTQPDAKLSILPLDLSSFDSIKECAEKFNGQSTRLDLLFLNAGIAAVAPSLTHEGYEQQFGVNHVGHALLTQLLMPKLLQTKKIDPDADLRIMLTSSLAGEKIGPKFGIVLDQMKNKDAIGSPMERYGHTKFANILFARKLAQVYPDITSTSFHPGVVKTEIWGKASGMKLLVFLLSPWVFLAGLTPDEGAVPGLWLATAKDGVQNGKYYVPGCKEKSFKNSDNQTMTDELWEWTNKELAQHGGPGWATESS